MLIKYIIILYLITPDLNYSLSIRKDIDMAKQFLKYHGISNPDLCTVERVRQLCSNNHKEVCSARLRRKKMEFKQFDNPCYMDLNNFCESQDNIWTIKNSGPCIMNVELRRFAKEIEKMADDTNSTEQPTDDDKTTDDGDETTTLNDKATDEEVTETADDNTITENNTTEYATEPLREDENETTTEETVTDETTDLMTTEVTEVRLEDDEGNDTTNDETTIAEDETTEETVTDDITTAIETNPVDETTIAVDEIGKIYYDDGSVKAALREGQSSTRFPPMLGKKSWDKKPCEKRVKPCPNIYYPVCLYFAKEKPNNITYYYFINSCEAQQYTCYHPERKIDGSSSVRAGFCAHIQYINYARFFHTMSAWGHYGWLHGPWPFNHILKPHERA